jgi:AbrB family looped-hinge helix DNA binding protein
MTISTVRVQEKGQVTIPLEIRRKLNLKKGDLVTFVETEEGVLIKPIDVVTSELLDQIGSALKEKGLNLEELLERGREIRKELIEGKYHLTNDSAE